MIPKSWSLFYPQRPADTRAWRVMHRRTHLKRQDFIHIGQISTTPLLYQSNNASAASALITAQLGVNPAI